MEVEMKMVKSLLLGTAAGLVAVAGAQAAELATKAKPVEYVKVCSLYGDGFFYIPGTDTCIKLGGYLRVQSEYNAGAGGQIIGSGAGEGAQARFTRDATNDVNYRTRFATSWDIRQQTEYGTLRTYGRFGAENSTPGASGAGTAFTAFWDRAFMQLAGFTIGRTQSFFDLVTYGGAYSLHNVRVAGDTGAAGLTLWAYTAQFGNGFSASLSVEDPNGHGKAGTIDNTNTNFWGLNGATLPCNAFSVNAAAVNTGGVGTCPAANGFGFRMPDIVLNFRYDQKWGYTGISGAIHDASGSYYLPFIAPGAPAIPGAFIDNGHPSDVLGWAVSAGALFNLPGNDHLGFNVCGTIGAPGYCTNIGTFQAYNSSTSVGVGWISDGVYGSNPTGFGTGNGANTSVFLTHAWSALAFYEHIWNPRWRTAWGGGFVAIHYGDEARDLINSGMAASALLPAGRVPTACARPFPVNGVPTFPLAVSAGSFTAVTATAGNSCDPSWSFWELYTRTQWNPVAQLDIGLELLYTHFNTAYKGPGVYATNAPRPPIFLFDDQNVWSAQLRFQRNFYP
jgi:hypothetical protein